MSLKVRLDGQLSDINFLNSFSAESLLSSSISLEQEELVAASLVREALRKSEVYAQAHDYKLPDHLEQFRLEYENVEKKRNSVPMPEIRQLSPRTRKHISLLPKPTEYEEKKIKQIEEWANKVDTAAAYSKLPRLPLSTLEDIPSPLPIPAIGKIMSKDLFRSSAGSDVLPVDNQSTHYYVTMEHARKYEKEKLEKLDRLFNKLDDGSVRSKGSKKRSLDSKDVRRVNAKLPALIANGNSALRDFVEAKRAQSPQDRLVSIVDYSADTATIMSSSVKAGTIKGFPNKEKSRKTPLNLDFEITVSASIASEDSTSPAAVGSFKSSPSMVRDLSTDFRNNQGEVDIIREYEPILKSTQALTSALNDKYVKQFDQLLNSKKKAGDQSEKEFLNLFSERVLDEIGLDLNKEYNRVRHFKLNLMKLSYNFYIHRLKSGFAQFTRQSVKLKSMILNRAAFIICRALRRFNIVLNEHRRMKMLKEQARQEAIRLERRLNVEKYSSKVITRAIFLYTRRKKFHREWRIRRSCTKIQARMRGFLTRKAVHVLRSKRLIFIRNATTIQCAYRCRLARRKVALFRKLQFVQKWMAEVSVAKNRRMQLLAEDGAEICIAKAYRTLMIRRKLKKLVYWNHFRVAIIIQRYVRGHLVRRRMIDTFKNHRIKKTLENKSAVAIQAQFRRHRCVKLFHNRVLQKAKLDHKRKQQKMLKLATAANRVNIFWLVRKLFRKIQPFRYLTLNRNAIVIQRYWRGHHGRVRFFMIKCSSTLSKLYDKYVNDTIHAKLIQRHWRGYITRLRLWRKKLYAHAVKIQCLFRIFKAKLDVHRMKQSEKNASRLVNLLLRLLRRFKFRRTWKRNKLFGSFVTKIQSIFRREIAKRKVKVSMSKARYASESNVYLSARMNHLLSRAQLALIQETLVRNIGQKYYTFSKKDCFCLGPVQAIFSLAAVSKGRTEQIALFTNKADPSSVLKFVKSITGLLEKREDNVQQNDNAKKRGKVVKKDRAFELNLLKSYDLNILHNPSSKRKLKPTEVDSFFNRSKKDLSGGNYLSYTEFTDFLSYVAEVHYTGSIEARKNATSEDSIPTKQIKANNSKQSVTSTTPVSSSKYSLKPEQVYFNMSNIHNRETNYRVWLIVNVLSSLRKESWMKDVLEWIDAESRARLGYFAIRIQCLVRRFQGKNRFAEVVLLRLKQMNDKRLNQLAIKIQAVARMFISRYRVARLAQKVLIQYVPYLLDPYWFHPLTKVKTYRKPKVLRSLDSYSIALPEEGLENVVNCFYCNKLAEVNCDNCEESMCKICYDSMHCKGNRREHQSSKILSCSYCKFQVATKSCLTCILNPVPLGNIKESVEESCRGLYCDTCFTYEHDRSQKSLNIQQQRRRRLKNILAYTKQAYLIHNHLHQSLDTNHHFDNLVQTCEECNWRSSSWRCVDCNQIYCNICLVGLHSMGGPFSRHKAEQLPYYTPQMHTSFKNDIDRQMIKIKLTQLNRDEAIKKELKQRDMALKIQSWWRMVYIGRLGRKEMKRRRRRQRITYKAYKKESEESRRKVTYMLLNLLGYAPPLATDTREDAVLRSVNVFQKQNVREVIWKNKDDWGFYRVSRTSPRKGTPISGFNVGTIEELSDQARCGGYRLPGRVFVVPGSNKFKTSYDLSSIIRAGEIVRIRTRCFGVVEVEGLNIIVNRFWRAGTEESRGKDDGEIMYRMPMYNGEPSVLSSRLRYLSYSTSVENPVSQGLIQLYKFYAQRMMSFSLSMVHMNRSNGMKEEADSWRATSMKYADTIRYATSFLLTNQDFVELYGTESLAVDEPLLFEDDNIVTRKAKQRKGLVNSLAKELQQTAGSQFYESDTGISMDDDQEDTLSPLRIKPIPPKRKTYKSVAVDDDSQGESSNDIRDESLTRPRTEKKGMPQVSSNNAVPFQSVAFEDDYFDNEYENDEEIVLEDEYVNESEGADGDVQDFGDDRISDVSEKRVSRKIKSEKAISSGRPSSTSHDRRKLSRTPEATIDEGIEESTTQQESRAMKKEGRVKAAIVMADKPWYATSEQVEARKKREDKMTPEQLAKEADVWTERIDPITENIFYLNIKTNEIMSSLPKALEAKRQLDFQNSKNKKYYDDAQKRISRLETMIHHRKLIAGGTKK